MSLTTSMRLRLARTSALAGISAGLALILCVCTFALASWSDLPAGPVDSLVQTVFGAAFAVVAMLGFWGNGHDPSTPALAFAMFAIYLVPIAGLLWLVRAVTK